MQPKKTSFLSFTYVCSMLHFLCITSLFAQTDSLQGKSYEELITLYNNNLYSNATYSEAYAFAANKVAFTEKNQLKIATTSFYIATSKYYLGKHQEALSFTKKSLKIANEINDNNLLFNNHNLNGNIYSNLEKEFTALDQYLLAKKYADAINNPIQIITVSVNIAFLKKLHYDHQEALKILKENLSLIDEIPESNAKRKLYERILLMNITDTYLRIKNPKEASIYNKKGIISCENEELNIACLAILMNKAIIHYQFREYDKAIEISNKVKNGYLQLKNENLTVTPNFYLGKSFFQNKQFKKAIKYLEKAIQTSIDKKIAFTDQKEAHKILYQSYTEIGNAKKASENFDNYSKLDRESDSINMLLNNKIHKEYDIVPLQEEINYLGKYTSYLYVASILLLLSLISFFIWFKRKQKQNKIRFQELLVTINELEKPKEKIISETEVKESSTHITDENVNQILQALEIFEEKKLYLRQDCTLGYVAKKVKTNTSYLSSVINTYKEKPFKSYLTELRINAALIQLKNDDKLRSYTIKAIAEEFGYKRSETFSRAFKAQTGMYPSYYIKSLKNQKDI